MRINRVRAASIGARTNADKAAAAVAMRTVEVGEGEESIEESGIDPEDNGSSTSLSAIPNTAAIKLLKNVSRVRTKMLYTKVEFVARHMPNAPLFEERDDNASMME